jgi:hypothetical protein
MTFTVIYLVPDGNVTHYLNETGFIPVLFDGQAMVSFKFILYSGQFASTLNLPKKQSGRSGADAIQELELSIVVHPNHRVDQEASISYQEYVHDGSHKKIFDNHRVWVPCDANITIEGGKGVDGEPKIKASFKINISLQDFVCQNSEPNQPVSADTLGLRVNDPDVDSTIDIFTCIVNTAGHIPVAEDLPPITEYDMFKKKMLGRRWNRLQPMYTYFVEPASNSAVALTFGRSTHPLKTDMQALPGRYQAIGVRTCNSTPVDIKSRSYYS